MTTGTTFWLYFVGVLCLLLALGTAFLLSAVIAFGWGILGSVFIVGAAIREAIESRPPTA